MNRPPAILAWMVHALTASGAVLAFLALVAIERGEFNMALIWLVVALAIDGVDGSLARMVGIKQRLPWIDGAALDLIVDYLTYVFIPTVLIWRAGLVPLALAMPLAALIQLSALFHFARADMKTEDNYFRGFPALWNVVAFYLFVSRPGEGVGAVLVLAMAALTFAPVHFVHPFRVLDYGRWLPAIALLWTAATVALLWPGWDAEVRSALLAASAASGLALIGLGLLRSVRGPRAARPVVPPAQEASSKTH